MTIQKFIKNEIVKRIQEFKCIVFYDPEKKYKEIIDTIDEYEIVDGTNSTIIGREIALEKFATIGNEVEGLLIYLPIKRLDKDIDLLANPYLIFEVGGSYFPKGDSDTYISLCKRAFPDKREKLDEVFDNHANPDFEVINTTVASGKRYPIICSLLKAESTTEILTAVLSPTSKQFGSLSDDENWQAEFKQFLKGSINYSLKTRSKKLESIQDELWRVVLLSEFVFDLPTDPPSQLTDIPRLDESNESLVYVICDNLRQNERHQEKYTNYAIEIEKELSLRNYCKNITEFGVRDTFEFEERTFLSTFVDHILSNNINTANEIYTDRLKAIWVKHSEERQLLWTLAGKGLEFFNLLDQANHLLAEFSKNLYTLIQGYSEKLYKIDKAQREFEQLVSDTYGNLFSLSKLVDKLREDYDLYFDKLHNLFIEKITKDGWPVDGQLRNTILFDRFIDPFIKERKKVAFVMADSLRYELAVDLYDKLQSFENVEIHPVCAQLPTTTKVGMASLLPNADGNFKLINVKENLLPHINDSSITTPDDRIKYIKKIYGDIAHSIWIDELTKHGPIELPNSVNFLIVKTKDIDDLGENMPTETVSLIPKMIQKLYAAISSLQALGFEKVFIATDHGFILKTNYSAGDNVQKPTGNWIESKRRCLIGNGDSNGSTLHFNPTDLGITSEEKSFVIPKSYHAFIKGSIYYHEGISLQECVLPFISLSLKSDKDKIDIPVFSLSYKGGKTDEITSLRPMIELTVSSEDLFETEFEILLEAYSGDEIIAESAPSQYLDLTSNTLKLNTGNSYKLPLKMPEEFEGEFEVRVIDPQTNIIYARHKLKTNYMD